MESVLTVAFKPTFNHQQNPLLNSPNFNLIKSNPTNPLFKPFKQSTIKTTATTTVSADTKPQNNPITQTLKLTARTIVFSAAAAAVISKFQQYPAIADPITQTATTTVSEPESEIPDMKTGEDEESLKLLEKVGETELGREALEQILTENPLSFEALFEKAVLMDSCGEGEVVIKRLEKVIEEDKDKEARDVRLVIAQVKFLQKNVDEALKIYDELVSEDPNDFRPYFCKGMIYSLIDKIDEAKVEYAKYRELSPKEFEVEGYNSKSLSRLKLFGTDEQN